MTVWFPYVPSATSTTSPGFATRYARLSERQGATREQGLLSEPVGERNKFALEFEHESVEAFRVAWAEWLPAASRASTAKRYEVPQLSPETV